MQETYYEVQDGYTFWIKVRKGKGKDPNVFVKAWDEVYDTSSRLTRIRLHLGLHTATVTTKAPLRRSDVSLAKDIGKTQCKEELDW